MFDAKNALAAVLEGKTNVPLRVAASRVATILLLADADPSLIRLAVEGLRSSRYRVDARLLEEIYWGSSSRYRPTIAGSGVVALLPAETFRRIWLDALRRHEPGSRGRLAEGLLAFLNHNPKQAAHFQSHIRSLASDRNLIARRTGVLLLSALDDVAEEDLSVAARHLRNKSAEFRLAALCTVQRWTMRIDSLPSSAREFLRGAKVRAEVRRAMRDSDESVRMAGRNCARLLRAYAKDPEPPPESSRSSPARLRSPT